MLCKCYSVDSGCAITPGDRNLTKHPTAVILVLNCTFNGRSVDTVSWKRNKQPVLNNTLVDSAKRKKWSAAVLYRNSTSIQDVGKFTCVAKRGQHVFSCSVQPSKALLCGFWLKMVEYSGFITLGCFSPYWRRPKPLCQCNGGSRKFRSGGCRRVSIAVKV